MTSISRSTRVLWLALLASLLAAGCGGEGTKPAAAPPPADSPSAAAGTNPSLTVTTTTPQRTTLVQTLAANGNLAAWQEAIVGAETGGQRLTEVRVNVGDTVKRGQVLATFARETVNAETAQSRAALAEAEAAAAEAKANAERARSLEATGALSVSQINQYVTAAATAEARVQAARAAFQAREVRQGQLHVLAPDDGIISSRSATVGAVVGSGTELFRLIRQGRLEWRAEVTASELGRLRAGAPAEVTAASGAVLQGRVRTIGPTVDPQTRQALVYVDVKPRPGDGGQALPGMFARGVFELGSSPALTVPQSALVVREGFSYLMQVNAENRVNLLRVKAGRVVNDRVEILDGLAPDQRIVTAGGGFLNEGDLVRVVDAPAAAAGSGPANGAASDLPNGPTAAR